MNEFWLCFVPLFVAVDVIGVLPIFLGMTHTLDRRDLPRIIYRSVATATVIALVFAAAGPQVLHLLGIGVTDFMVAGGALLLAIAARELIVDKEQQARGEMLALGAVPLGVPLLTGPAVLATSILLVDQYGFGPTGVAILANMVIAGAVFRFGGTLRRILGSAGATIASKVANLFLAAIGVMMMRRGIEAILTAGTTYR